MNHIKIFIDLTRLNKPIGFMLLFWPCSWGLAFANFYNNNNLLIYYLILFFIGSVLMRSAGCIFNDIVDKDIDQKVDRTKKRPIAAGKISVKQSLIYVFVLCALAFIVLIQFNFLTIMLGMSSMLLAFAYPFMKRITYWPQLFLGLTFNWGLVMAWTSMGNSISAEIIVLYISAIFWTLGYDTIYGIQDMSDDEIIGVKSTSIKFKKNIKYFVSLAFLTTGLCMLYVLRNFLGLNLSTFLIFLFFLSLLYQILVFKINNSKSCLKAFKFNNVSGAIVFFSILVTNL